MNDAFRRVLDLVRRTGDRMVVTDAKGDRAVVVMDLGDYEGVVDMEEQYFSHLAGEDASSDEDDDLPDDLFTAPDDDEPEPKGPPSAPSAATPEPPDIWDVMAPAGETAETWDINKLTPEERAEFEEVFQQAAEGKKRDPEPVKSGESKKEEDFGEEQFYLEPIE